MFGPLAKRLDHWVIDRAATRCQPATSPPRAEDARALLTHPDFFCNCIGPLRDLRFQSERDFCFPSPVPTSVPENNLVPGRLFKSGPAWAKRPAVVLLHGWNGEHGYHYQYPLLAWRLARLGLNTIMFVLPFHGGRKPARRDSIRNFISHDLYHMVECTRQAVAEIRCLVGWLRNQGCPSVGLWGFSLGAWLAGLTACHDPHVDVAVLTSPVINLGQAIQDLAFCEPIRKSLIGNDINLERLSLGSYRPRTGLHRTLLVQPVYDQFAPPKTVEELWQAWQKPEMWSVPHGHISVLLSVPVLERTMRWLRQRTVPG